MSAPGFRLNGWHVLAMLLGFFVLVATANAIFITFAVRSFPGEEEEKPYIQGIHYNDHLAERAQQAALGWSVEIVAASLADGHATIDLVFKDASDMPIYGLDVNGRIARPASSAADQLIIFTPLADGVYRAEIEGVDAGVWKLKAHAQSERDEAFDLETRLVLE